MGSSAEVEALKRELEAHKAALRKAEKQNRELQDQVESSLKLKSAVEDSVSRAKELKTVDVCFVIDCTASMSRCITAAKKKIREVANFILSAMGSGASVRFAIVGYRDVDDIEHPVVLDFTSDTAECERFLASTDAEGGGDACEDVLTGLDAAVRLSWAGKVRILFLISQTPNHGTRFHDRPAEVTVGVRPENVYDLHRDTERQWDFTDELMVRIRSLDIRLVCLELNITTRKMYGVFASLYDDHNDGFRMLTEPLGFDPASFYAAVARSSWASITASLTATASKLRPTSFREPLLLDLDQRPIDWSAYSSWPEFRVEVLSYTLNKLWKEPKVNTTERTVRLAPAPFARGGMRYAFAVFDETSGSKLVAKAYAFKDSEFKSMAVFEGDMLTQVYAQQLADDWCRRLPDSPMTFVQAQILKCPPGSPFELMAVEPFIPGNYEKQTNNASYVKPNSEVAQAFSHFTWHVTGGRLMVTDIQGVRTTLTDPQIHSEKDIFGCGNFGTKGMDAFFLSHRCGATCKALNVKENPVQPSSCPKIPEWRPVGVAEEHFIGDTSDTFLDGLRGETLMDDLRTCARVRAFDKSVHEAAARAMTSSPAEEDSESGKGGDWFGGIKLAWTSPPMVREVKPEVQGVFEKPIKPGDTLITIDGDAVAGLERREILRRLARCTGLGFADGVAGRFTARIRQAALRARDSPPEAEDPESGKGRDWLGDIQLAWTSPPTVRDVKPEVNKFFRRPVTPGDTLHSVNGEKVKGLCRSEILRRLSTCSEIGFRDNLAARTLSRLLEGDLSSMLSGHVDSLLQDHLSALLAADRRKALVDVRVEEIGESRATVTWTPADAARSSAATWSVEVLDPQGVVAFHTESHGLRADVTGLRAATPYTVRVRAVGGGRSPPEAATAEFRTADVPGYEFLCDGKCGTMVHMVSGREFGKLRKNLGVFCGPCRQRAEATMCERGCAKSGCRRRVQYSAFAVECRGLQDPTLCAECVAEEESTFVMA